MREVILDHKTESGRGKPCWITKLKVDEEGHFGSQNEKREWALS